MVQIDAAWEGMLAHIHQLAEVIGPRGSTTSAERAGADYCKAQFQRMGLDGKLETFRSATSIFRPHLIASLVLLGAFIIYPIAGHWSAVAAAVLAVVTFVSDLLELSFITNPLRWVVPKGTSQNVFSVIPPAGDHHHDMILIAHIDTQRTPLIFRTPAWVEAYKGFTTVAFVFFAWECVLYTLGSIFQWPWLWWASVPSAVCAVLLALICIEADRSPFTAGANDNASSVAMVLKLAEQFARQPLAHTRLWLLCTGCEEVQHYGAADFFKRHRKEMKDPKGLVFELVGCAGPGYLTREGIIIPFHSDAGLFNLAQTISREHPEWDAYPVSINGGNSELADCVLADVPAITLFGLKKNGEAPYWHQRGDTVDKIQPEILMKNYQMALALILRSDQKGR
jgi:hypothetical protein